MLRLFSIENEKFNFFEMYLFFDSGIIWVCRVVFCIQHNWCNLQNTTDHNRRRPKNWSNETLCSSLMPFLWVVKNGTKGTLLLFWSGNIFEHLYLAHEIQSLLWMKHILFSFTTYRSKVERKRHNLTFPGKHKIRNSALYMSFNPQWILNAYDGIARVE